MCKVVNLDNGFIYLKLLASVESHLLDESNGTYRNELPGWQGLG